VDYNFNLGKNERFGRFPDYASSLIKYVYKYWGYSKDKCPVFALLSHSHKHVLG